MPTEQFQSEWSKISDKPYALAASETINKIIGFFDSRGIKNVIFDPYIVRGFDYYTGMVFEVNDSDPVNRRSIFGGGRFDNLTELFGGDKIPAVGFGMGDVTIRDFLETHDLLPTYKPSAQLYIAVQDENCRDSAEQLATVLRGQSIDVAVDISHKKLGDQIKIADRQKIPFATAIGAEEVKAGAYRIKNLADGQEKILKTDEIASYLKAQLLFCLCYNNRLCPSEKSYLISKQRTFLKKSVQIILLISIFPSSQFMTL